MKAASSKRDKLIDGLRGVLLLVMGVEHCVACILPQIGYLNPIRFPGLGIFSAAEGFIFLAGFSAGLAYFPKYLVAGMAGIQGRILTKLRQLYFAQILLLLTALVTVPSLWEDTSFSSFLVTPAESFLRGMFLLYQPALLNILPLFLLFIACVPGLLKGIATEKRRWIFGSSLALWLFAQVPHYGTALRVLGYDYFNVFAWQALFVGGILLSTRPLGDLPGERVFRKVAPLLFVAGIMVRFNVDEDHLSRHLEWLLNRNHIGVLRALSDLSLFAIIASLREPLRRFFAHPATQVLSFLGGHSLAVFTWHVAAIYALSHWRQQFATLSEPTQILILLGYAISLPVMAVVDQWKKGIRFVPAGARPFQKSSSEVRLG